jgi:PDZ domain-containing secreted protein
VKKLINKIKNKIFKKKNKNIKNNSDKTDGLFASITKRDPKKEPYFGFDFRKITENEIDPDAKPLVTYVDKISPCHNKLKIEDLILAINGISVKTVKEFFAERAKFKPGEMVELQIKRQGNKLVKNITLISLSEFNNKLKNEIFFNIEMKDLSGNHKCPGCGSFYHENPAKEPRITFVQAGGLADQILEIDDLICKINGTSIKTIDDYAKERIKFKWGQKVTLVIERKGKVLTKSITPISHEDNLNKQMCPQIDVEVNKKKEVSIRGIYRNLAEDPGFYKDSLLQKEMLKENDVILSLNSKKIKSIQDWFRKLSKIKLGKKIPLKIKRGSKKINCVLKLFSFSEFLVRYEFIASAAFNFNNTQTELFMKEFKENNYTALHEERIKEIQNMDLEDDEDKKRIIENFSTYHNYKTGVESGNYIKKWDKKDIELLRKLLKPRFNELNFETSALNLYFNPQLVEYFKKFDTKIEKGITSCITYMLNWHVPGGSPDGAKESVSVNVKNFEKLISAKDKKSVRTLIYDEASDSEKISFFKNTGYFTIKYTSNQNGKLKTEHAHLSISGKYGFEDVCERFSNWLKQICGKSFHRTKNNLAMKEWRESFFEGYPDFTLERLNEIKEMDLEEEYSEEEDYSDEEYNDNEEKIYLTTTVKKEKVAGKESFVLTLDGFPDDAKLETLGDDKKIFLKIYVFDVTDLDSDKYYEICDTTGLTDQYFSNHCHIIKTNEITWSDGNMNLIQSKELEPYGDHPTKLAFPYSVMLLPKVGKRRLSFRTFLCTDKQKFDDTEGRPKDDESINYRPESFKMDDYAEYGFDDYGDYPEILSYTSSEIDVEYKQPGYLDINKRKYNDLKIALGSALNQLGGGSLKENFEKIKDEIRYDGDYSAEGNIYKSLSLKSNYEHALKEKIDLESILKELKKNSRIHERYEMIDLLLNLAITDETYSAKENEFIDKVAKTLDLHNEKFQEIKKQKTASVKFVDFGNRADESIFGITKDMDKKKKLRVLRKEYSRWNALTNNSDKAIRERAREMRDLAANIRRQYT